MKDCMFQYANGYGIIFENTGLITREDAEALWYNYEPNFIEIHKEGWRPEMCIWIDCTNDGDYHTSIWHANEDSICRNGHIYEMVRVDIKETK